MNVRMIAVGKVHERYINQACEEFMKRLRPYYPLEVIEVRHAASGSLSEEAERILRLLHQDDMVWLLDRAGTQLSSEELSTMLADISHRGTRRLTLVIGGTFGADKRLVERADFVWSLSRLTLLHEWARALVLEQIYRAAKIARNEPYHH
ncbi:MAG TPA: 23S rRNA (pseudouridine(1915)-N(3))-methyltransferase RlmH [Candidatus Baltobacteraceae bacterium]|nr:23S rRNA (pseudouridine(1915)-N(3))-methyltransferase RlmH [Candidatus Baltobacteraceae bacterium]